MYDGHVIDMLGPLPGDRNNAQIMKHCVDDHSGLGGFLQAGGVCFVDRGFRDVNDYPESKGYAYMPASKKRKHLAAEDANKSKL